MTGAYKSVYGKIRSFNKSSKCRLGFFEHTQHRKIIRIFFSGIKYAGCCAGRRSFKSYAEEYDLKIRVVVCEFQRVDW